MRRHPADTRVSNDQNRPEDRLKRKRRIALFNRKRHAVSQPPTAAVATLPTIALPPARRALHLLQAALRFCVPVVGVLVFNLSAPQLILLYFVDTWLALLVVFSLLMLSFFPVRDWVHGSIFDRFSHVIGIFFAAMFIASFVMVTVAFPLIYVHHAMPLTEIMQSPTFQNAVFWHIIFSLTAFASQGWELAQVSDAIHQTQIQWQLRRRFFYIFLRWFAVYFLTFVPFVQFVGARAMSVLYVIAYSAFGFATELFPRKFEKMLQEIERDLPKS